MVPENLTDDIQFLVNKERTQVKEIRPWYRWHWQRNQSAESTLAFAKHMLPPLLHGCYRLLLDAMWQFGGKIPTDREVLYGLARFKRREDYEKVADIVESFFQKTEDGQFFTHQTLIEEWDSATDVLGKRREAGQKGGLAKARNLLQQNPSNALASSSSSNSNSNNKTPLPPLKDENFDGHDWCLRT
jgi:uncharacterized protein YdaU (DUF1376 family)